MSQVEIMMIIRGYFSGEVTMVNIFIGLSGAFYKMNISSKQ